MIQPFKERISKPQHLPVIAFTETSSFIPQFNLENLSYYAQKGRKHIARGEALGQRNNIDNQPQRGERKRNFILAGTFTFLGIHQYIKNQQNHHRKRSFQEEFIDMLTKHGVEYDENYIWK